MKRELPIPSWAEVEAMAPRLCEWTDMATHSFGHYKGVNEAIAAASDKSTDAAMMANDVRHQFALMAVIRCFAVFDRSSAQSFQSANRAFTALTATALNALPQSARHQFATAYSQIDISSLQRMQSFRNDAIAHVSWRDAQRFITYGELEALTRIACELAHALNLMTSGLNNAPIEHFDYAYDQSFQFWTAALRDDPDPFTLANDVANSIAG